MPHPLLRLALAVLGVVLATSSAGCTLLANEINPPAVPTVAEVNVAIVAGATQGAAGLLMPDGTAVPAVADLLTDLAGQPGRVTIVRSDGAPASLPAITLEHSTERSQTADAVRHNHARLAAALQQAQARTAEADPLAALAIAGNVVRNKPDATIVVISNGLSTTGPLLMQAANIVGVTAPADLAAQAAGLVGRLDDVAVTWIGLCDTTAPQQPCPQEIRDRLRELYTTVLTDAGAASVTFDDTPLAGGTPVSAPLVTPVPWTTTTITVAPPVTRTLFLQFVPNEATYADEDEALTALTELTALLADGAYEEVYAYGCVHPDGSPQAALDRLSARRASAVAADLERLGVTAPIHAAGLAQHCPGAVNSPDEDQAWRDMRVIVSTVPLEPQP